MLAVILFGPYLLLVLPTYLLVRRQGRPYHVSDWAAMFAPIAVYFGLESYDHRQGLSVVAALPIVGCVVAVCVSFRGSRRLSLPPWTWGIGTSLIGTVVAVVTWCAVEHESTLERLPVILALAVVQLLTAAPYYLIVGPAYGLVLRYGRPRHVSDLVATLVPIVLYVGLELYQDRQGWNFLVVPLSMGCVVAVCVLFRGSKRLLPWAWAIGTSLIGAVIAVVLWRTVSHEGMTRLF